MTPYTDAELELLKTLRTSPRPMSWKEIQALYFPDRTYDALKMKFYQMWPTGNGRGRLRLSSSTMKISRKRARISN